KRLLDAQALLQDLLRIIDLAAARAGEIALEERLEHQHQRIPLLAPELARGDVATDTVHLHQRDTQALLSLLSCLTEGEHRGAVLPPAPRAGGGESPSPGSRSAADDCSSCSTSKAATVASSRRAAAAAARRLR